MEVQYDHLVTSIREVASECERSYHGCSQCVLGALQDRLTIGTVDS